MKLFYSLFLAIFTWWHGQTWGTRIFTLRRGKLVGADENGNRYYLDRKRKSDKRWVVYAGEVEASCVPPGWRAWLHHTVDEIPTEQDYMPRPWEKPHLPNQTGTANAYVPKGSLLHNRKRRKERAYQAWRPE